MHWHGDEDGATVPNSLEIKITSQGKALLLEVNLHQDPQFLLHGLVPFSLNFKFMLNSFEFSFYIVIKDNLTYTGLTLITPYEYYKQTNKKRIWSNIRFENIASIQHLIEELEYLQRNTLFLDIDLEKINILENYLHNDFLYLERNNPVIKDDMVYWLNLILSFNILSMKNILYELELFTKKNNNYTSINSFSSKYPYCQFEKNYVNTNEYLIINKLIIENTYTKDDYVIELKYAFLYSMNVFDQRQALQIAMTDIQQILNNKKDEFKFFVRNDSEIYDSYFIIEKNTAKYYGFLDIAECPEDVFSVISPPFIGEIETINLYKFMENYLNFLNLNK